MATQQEHSKFELGEGNTIARIRKGSTTFEILVNMEDAMKVKKGESEYLLVEGDAVFTDIKKGNRASNAELQVAFNTNDLDTIAKEIVRRGDVLVDSAHRGAEQEQKIKQIIDFLSRNAIDPKSGRPITAERLKSAINEAHVNIKNVPLESQIHDIVDAISVILPIKIETRKIKVIVPALQTGKAYGLLSQYKEKENWLANGSLEAVVNIPAGILIDFYDKLNSVTHGSALTEEITQ
jgi:ribosome maturation protein SDO1